MSRLIKFVFLISPNNSGTTAISRYLAGRYNLFLPPFGNNEGQMAPAVKKIMRVRQWKPDQSYDWQFIRAEWEKLLAESAQQAFMEASPPNMVRFEELYKVFRADSIFIFSIANPYAHIGSIIYNYRQEPVGFKVLLGSVWSWVEKAKIQMENINRHPSILRTSYEEFCSNSSVADAALSEVFGSPVDDRDVQIGGARKIIGNELRNMNLRNISFFKPEELVTLGKMLSEEQEVLDFFGYPILDEPQISEIFDKSNDDVQAGLERRRAYDERVGQP